MPAAGDAGATTRRALAAWKEGRTGYPIVDAGMRQLLREGFMHNRARLIVASFLTKDLYVDWRVGRRALLRLACGRRRGRTTVGNWQWVAGTGADTRPNRVFNPIRQAKRFDSDGDVCAPVRCRSSQGSKEPRCTSRGSSGRSAQAITRTRSSTTTKPPPASAGSVAPEPELTRRVG